MYKNLIIWEWSASEPNICSIRKRSYHHPLPPPHQTLPKPPVVSKRYLFADIHLLRPIFSYQTNITFAASHHIAAYTWMTKFHSLRESKTKNKKYKTLN